MQPWMRPVYPGLCIVLQVWQNGSCDMHSPGRGQSLLCVSLVSFLWNFNIIQFSLFFSSATVILRKLHYWVVSLMLLWKPSDDKEEYVMYRREQEEVKQKDTASCCRQGESIIKSKKWGINANHKPPHQIAKQNLSCGNTWKKDLSFFLVF